MSWTPDVLADLLQASPYEKNDHLHREPKALIKNMLQVKLITWDKSITYSSLTSSAHWKFTLPFSTLQVRHLWNQHSCGSSPMCEPYVRQHNWITDCLYWHKPWPRFPEVSVYYTLNITIIHGIYSNSTDYGHFRNWLNRFRYCAKIS